MSQFVLCFTMVFAVCVLCQSTLAKVRCLSILLMIHTRCVLLLLFHYNDFECAIEWSRLNLCEVDLKINADELGTI